MPDNLDPNKTVDFKELLLSQVVQSEALINLLVRKGIITEEELLDEVDRVNAGLENEEE